MESPQVYNTTEQKIALLRGQLRNVSRAIANIQKMEIELRTELKALTGAEFAEFMLQEKKKEGGRGALHSSGEVVRKRPKGERRVRVLLDSGFPLLVLIILFLFFIAKCFGPRNSNLHFVAFQRHARRKE